MKNIYSIMAPALLFKLISGKLITIVLLAALLFAGANPAEAQAPVNKQLYLKTGGLLDRVVPTSGSFQSTVNLFKQTASISGTPAFAKSFPPGGGAASPLTISSYTTPAGSNRLMIVTVVSDPENVSPPNNSVVTSVTYGGVALTKLDEAINPTNVKVELWYLKNPAVSTADVVVNWTPTTALQLIAGVTTLNDTDPDAPFGPVAKSTGSLANSTINVTSEVGDFIFDAIGDVKSVMTAVSPQIQNYNETSNKIGTASSRKVGIAGSTSMGWTFSSCPFAHIGVAIKGQSNDVTFAQSPVMCGSFTIKAGQTITILANAAVTSGTASGATLPVGVVLKHGAITIFTSSIAANSGLGANGTTGTLTWAGTIGSDYIVPPSGVLTLNFYNDYTSAQFRIDYDATSKQSRVTLPTTTYININNHSVYNSVYSGGSTITQRAVGVTNYIRTVVSDPFGFSDITGLNLVINGGAPIAATSVNTSGCTRTYEYAWTPTVSGTYNIQATAFEGTEGTVTAVSTITGFQVVQPSLTVNKTISSPASGPYTINSNIVYNIAIQNTGQSTLTSLPLQDLYSTSCLQYVSSSVTPNNISGGVITWNNIGTLTPGSTTNVTLTMKVVGACNPAANTARVENAKDNLNYVAVTQTSTVNFTTNQPPVANADSYCLQASTALSVLSNDTDADLVGFLSVPANAALYNVSIVSGPAKGSVLVNGDKTIQFNPLGGIAMSENNTVTFVYRVAEIAYPALYSDATVSILYSVVNTPPTAVADAANTTSELPVVINVLANDSDPDGTMTVSQITSGPSYGSAIINADHTITYTPFSGFEGTDVFTYQVCDNGCPTPVQCASAAVTIQVVFAYYVCQDGSSTISVNAVPGATGYIWTLPTGAIPASGTVTGSPIISVNWSGVLVGSHQVCVKPENNCGPGTDQCVNIVVSKPILTLTPHDVACNGYNSGSIDLGISGGIAPFTFAWTKSGSPGFSASVQNPEGLSSGIYYVTVTDKSGCAATGSTTVSQPATALQVSGVVTNENPYGSANGSVVITATGGTPSYIYAWSNGVTTKDITGLAGGGYTITVTDANGCQVIKSFTINQIGGPLSVSSITKTNVLCYGQNTGTIDLEVIGGATPYSYIWSNSATTQDLTGLTAGTYSVTVTDNVGAKAYSSIAITQPAAALAASTSVTNVTCYNQGNGSVSLSVSGGTVPRTYLWNTGAITQNLMNVGPGNYSVTVTDANACQTIASASITEPSIISVSGVVTNTSCSPAVGGTITLTVTGGTAGYTYLWSNGATTKDISGLLPGSYGVAVTDAAGCKTGKNFTVKESCIEVAKSVVEGPLNNQDGTYSLTYQVKVKNTGNTNLFNIQVTDNLITTFPAPAAFSVVSTSSAKFALGSFTGITPNISLLATSQSLIPGEEGLINITLTLTPGVLSSSYTNTAYGSGTDINGLPSTDDGPVQVNFTESPVIGIAKQLTGDPMINPDGSFDLEFTFKVRNYGDVPLQNVQVTDDLLNAFGAGATITVLSLTSSDMAVNSPGYNGTTNLNLLLGTDDMIVNEVNTIALSLRVTPSGTGTFYNIAAASGYGPGGTLATDDSQDGISPDPDNDGNPKNNDVPTPVTFPENPEIGAAKLLVGTPVNNNDGTYSVTYEITVKNTGDVGLVNVQVTDNLTTTFSGKPVVKTDLSSAYFHINNLYDGTSNFNLLTGSDILAVGAQYTILLTVKVTPGSDLGPYNNSATASGLSIFGTEVDDVSHNGIDVDPENNGTADNSDPTPVSFTEAPKMGLAKSVATVTNNNDGTYTVDYTIYVKNMGNVLLTNVQVSDNLATTFSGASSFLVQNVSATEGLTVNFPGYNGSGVANLLSAPNSNVAYNTIATISLSVLVTPGTKLGIYNNSASGTATGAGGTAVADVSYDGSDPDPDGDGNPNNNTLPTPVSFEEDPQISVTKGIYGSVVDNLNGTYTLTYEIQVENTGDVPLYNLQVVDDLNSTFANATGFIVDSKSVFQQPASTTLSINTSYNGSSNIDLLDGPGTLLFGESAILRFTVTVTPGIFGGPYLNSTFGLGISPAGSYLLNTDQVEVTFFENPAIEITKTVESVVANPDGTNRVTFRLSIENTGDVGLNNLEIFDDIVTQFAGLSPTDFVASEGLSLAVNPGWDGTATSNILAPGQAFDPEILDDYFVFISFTVTPGTTTSRLNEATVGGFGPLGAKATYTDETTINFLLPGISLAKSITSGNPYLAVDDVITYDYTITNTGDVTLPGPFTVVDDKIGTLTNCAAGPLAPLATVVCTGTYTVTADDLINGSVTNLATATTFYGEQTVTSNQATATAVAGSADLAVLKEVDNSTPNVGSNVTFTISITNNGPANATGVELTDLLPNGYSYVGSTISQGTAYVPATGLWIVGSLAVSASATLTITASVIAPGSGIIYLNTATKTASDQYDPDPDNDEDDIFTVPIIVIVADDDDASGTPVNGYTGGTAVTNVLDNDLLNGVAVIPSEVVITAVSDPADGVTLNTTTGEVTVDPGTAAGTYYITYEICEALNPANCDQALVTVVVSAAPILANADYGTTVNGYTGGTSFTNVLGNDLLNGLAVIPSEVTLTTVSSTSAGVTLSGTNVVVAAGTAAGNYTLIYKICEVLNPTNCDTAIVYVPVSAASIAANDDDATGSPVNGYTGGTAVSNVLDNDLLNGVAVIPSEVVITAVSDPADGVTLNTVTGEVTVDPGTAAGTYYITYQICEALNPANCDPALVTVVVSAAPILAEADYGTSVNGYLGGTSFT
ncbi:MAG: Ig-like domain-containing protein, partial [Bacteroidales bacterium]|nr:Ig-like domain-containing protein [Bacteroidales bacterium]